MMVKIPRVPSSIPGDKECDLGLAQSQVEDILKELDNVYHHAFHAHLRPGDHNHFRAAFGAAEFALQPSRVPLASHRRNFSKEYKDVAMYALFGDEPIPAEGAVQGDHKLAASLAVWLALQ
jgi:hypothetical protein